MKPKIILCLALVLVGMLTANSAPAAEPEPLPVLRIVVVPSKTDVHLRETFKVALRVENPTMTNQIVRVMSCSWDEEWQTSNPKISSIGWNCPKNFALNVTIPPGGAYTNELTMLIYDLIPDRAMTFRMGFTPISIKQVYWGDEVKLRILPPAADTASLHAVLAALCARVPGLSVESISDAGTFGQNSVTAVYTNSDGSRLRIIVKVYDSEAAAKTGQEMDERMISVSADKRETIQGVTVYEYARYGGLYFQTGPSTFRFEALRQGNEDTQPLLLKISSALIASLAPPAKSESAPISK